MPSGKSRSKEDTWKESDLKKALQDDKKKSKDDRKGKERSRDEDRRERRDRDDERRRRERRDEVASGDSDGRRDKDRERRRRERDDDKDRTRERDKEWPRDREKDKDRERTRERDQDRPKDRGDRDRDSDRGRDRGRDKDKERKKERDGNKDMSRETKGERERKGDREHRDKDKVDRSRDKDRDKERDKDRSRERRHRDRGDEDSKAQDKEERRRTQERKEKEGRDSDKDARRRERVKDDKRHDSDRERITKGEEDHSRERRHKDRSGDRRKDRSRERDDKERRKGKENGNSKLDLDEEEKVRSREREMLASLKKEEELKSKSKPPEGQRFRAGTLEEADVVDEEDETKNSRRHESLARMSSIANAEEVNEEEGGYDYEEDFEDYEEDFEDFEDEGDDTDEPGDRQGMQELLKAINAENELVLSREGSKLSRSSDDDSKRESAVRPVTAKGRINFVAAKQKQISEKVASRTRKRGQELMHLIDLDVTAFEMFDLPPMNEYELYIKNFGRSDTKQAYVQCNDDNVDREIQTEDVETRTMWTQNPPEDFTGCGDEQDKGNEFELSSLNEKTRIDSVNLTRFLQQAGQYHVFRHLCMDSICCGFTRLAHREVHNNFDHAVMACLVLLEEALAEQTSTMFKDKKDMACSDGYIQLATKQPLLAGRSVQCVHVSPVQTHLLLTAYGPVTNMEKASGQISESIASKGVVCLWNINEPSIPQKVLVCESVPRCCCLSPSKATLAFAGLEDGSVVAWDLRESTSVHHLHRIEECDVILRPPTFSTAGVLSQDNHHSPVVSLLPIVMPGDRTVLQEISHAAVSVSARASCGSLLAGDMLGLSFQLASLEENAVINIWVVVELEVADVAGSESDLGLAPGGKIKLIQSASLPLEPPYRGVRKTSSLQTLTMKFLPQDPNHFYIGTDGGYVLHRVRHGGRSPPKAYRPAIECLMDTSTIDVSPWQLPCILAGSKDGILRLYNLKNEFPLNTWSQFTDGHPIIDVQWSPSRPSVFYVLDADSRLHVWDLLAKDSGPVAVEKFKQGRVVMFELSSDYTASGIGMPGRTPELVLAYENGSVEVHRISAKFAKSSADELDRLDTYLDGVL